MRRRVLTLAVVIGIGLAGPIAAQTASPLGASVEAQILRLEDRRETGVEILRLLTSDAPPVRARAALAAGRIGDPQSVEALAALLRDPEAEVRAAAAFGLGEIEDSSAAEALALRVRSRDEPDPHVRALTIEGLGKLQAKNHAALCVAALGDAAPEVREAACLASWQVHAAEAAEPLLVLAADRDLSLRWKATYALMRMTGAPAAGATPIPGGTELAPEARERIRGRFLAAAADPDPQVRSVALRALGRFTDGQSAAALLAGLLDKDWHARVESLRALAAPYGGERPEPWGSAVHASMLKGSCADPNPNVRAAALDALGTIGPDNEAEPILRGAAASGPTRERQVAALALARRFARWSDAAQRDRETSELARALAKDPSWVLRSAAAEILAGASAPDTTLLRVLVRDDVKVAKLAAAPFLQQRAKRRPVGEAILPSIRGDLAWLLASPDPVLRALTLDAAGRILTDSTRTEADRAGWLGLLQEAWQRSRGDRENDVATTILGLLEPQAGDPVAQGILQQGRASTDPIIRREALRIQRAQPDAAPADLQEPPIETGRSLEEYGSILRWSEEPHLMLIETESDRIRIRLHAREATLTCWNFVRLAESGFFDGGAWHRVVPDFVVQDGCPRGDGYGGPGRTIRCEVNEHRYVAGAVGMALSGKDTGGSQFFITHSPQPHLDGRYTVFGQVVVGMDVLDGVAQGDRIIRVREVK